jgi:hypothetical protein
MQFDLNGRPGIEMPADQLKRREFITDALAAAACSLAARAAKSSQF